MILIAITVAVAWVLVALVCVALCVSAAHGDAALVEAPGGPRRRRRLFGLDDLRDVA